MDAEWVQKGSRQGLEWLQSGCRVDAEWMHVRPRMGTGCRVGPEYL